MPVISPEIIAAHHRHFAHPRAHRTIKRDTVPTRLPRTRGTRSLRATQPRHRHTARSHKRWHATSFRHLHENLAPRLCRKFNKKALNPRQHSLIADEKNLLHAPVRSITPPGVKRRTLQTSHHAHHRPV